MPKQALSPTGLVCLLWGLVLARQTGSTGKHWQVYEPAPESPCSRATGADHTHRHSHHRVATCSPPLVKRALVLGGQRADACCVQCVAHCKSRSLPPPGSTFHVAMQQHAKGFVTEIMVGGRECVSKNGDALTSGLALVLCARLRPETPDTRRPKDKRARVGSGGSSLAMACSTHKAYGQDGQDGLVRIVTNAHGWADRSIGRLNPRCRLRLHDSETWRDLESRCDKGHAWEPVACQKSGFRDRGDKGTRDIRGQRSDSAPAQTPAPALARARAPPVREGGRPLQRSVSGWISPGCRGPDSFIGKVVGPEMRVSEKGHRNLGTKRKRPRLVARVHNILRLGPRQSMTRNGPPGCGALLSQSHIANRKSQMPALAASEMGWEVSLIGLGHSATD